MGSIYKPSKKGWLILALPTLLYVLHASANSPPQCLAKSKLRFQFVQVSLNDFRRPCPERSGDMEVTTSKYMRVIYPVQKWGNKTNVKAFFRCFSSVYQHSPLKTEMN